MEKIGTSHAYSRAQAIEDGVLIDVTQMASMVGLWFRTAVTAAVWADHVALPVWVRTVSEVQRLEDIMNALLRAAAFFGGDSLEFNVELCGDDGAGEPPIVWLKAVIGPGDGPERVITIMLPGED